jgi:hypothetical protein
MSQVILILMIYFTLGTDHSTDLFDTIQNRAELKALTNKLGAVLMRDIKGTNMIC